MSDDYFDGEEFDSAFLKEIDAIEATQLSPARPMRTTVQRPSAAPPPPVRKQSCSDDFDMTFDVDAHELERLDDFIVDSYAGKAQPVPGPSRSRQTTLDGRMLPSSPPKHISTLAVERTKSLSRNPFGNKPQKTKRWDHTAFSETGWLSTKSKVNVKGKEKASTVDLSEDEDSGEELEFEQFPAPFVSSDPPPSMRLKPDLLAAKNWLYPLNRPRRDYQFNISKNCFFQNTLVALPTGLGKTFIAGVVMLNYYKWFPEGKIIFVAPTKPLVAQQIEASHQVCGIPGRDAVEMTGSVAKSKRTAFWAEKRVFYMTPQTFRNDLISGIIDPLNIILIVVDEAHKGTGDYAYAQVVRYMMAKNPHFRLLALTATPGNTPEAVQSIVDSLHISHIEIRNEQSQDLRRYIFEKEVKIHIIKMDESVLKIRDWLFKLIDPLLKQVRSSGLPVYTQSPVMLHPFACNKAIRDIHGQKNARSLGWAYGVLKLLGMLARAMGYLMECSSRMCLNELKNMRETLTNSDKPGDKKSREIFKDVNYVKLMTECERQQALGFSPHPKMEKLLALILSHFANVPENEGPIADNSASTQCNDSKVMVFVQFRDCVDEIVEMFERHKPLLRAARFIGQGTDKQGRKGINQAAQLEVIRRFKSGELNVLVSTSIGEEGLDIGEIDRIICYDAQKSSIRMLQRVGRTGRKRAGFVDVLLAEEREERNWDKSKENYTDVQDVIISGNQLELYDDVERLMPDDVRPKCLQTVMEIEEYVRSPRKDKSGKLPSAKGKKRKRIDDINRNIPLGAVTGFVTASELRVKNGPKAKKAKNWKPLKGKDVGSDSDDAEISGGLYGQRAERKKPTMATSKKSKAAKQMMDTYFKPLPKNLEDDSDDLEIQAGLTPSKSTPVRKAASVALSSDSDSPIRPAPPRVRRLQSSVPSPPKRLPRNHTSSSMGASTLGSGDGKKMDWLLGVMSDSDIEVLPGSPSPMKSIKPKSVGCDGPTAHFQSARSHMQQVGSGASSELATNSPTLDQSIDEDVASPLRDRDTNEGDGLLAIPEPTFAVRRPVKRKTVRVLPSSPTEPQISAPRRLMRRESSPPRTTSIQPPPKKKQKLPKLKAKDNPMLFDMEAAHSGDEVSEGHSDVETLESESDRRFLEAPAETQVSPSYNQTAAYRMSLLTQAPLGVDGPRFADRPKRAGLFAGGRTEPRRPVVNSSSPVRGSEPDEYDMGSFVVHDEDSIMYDNSSET